jgi:hypothetical protein
VLLARPPIWTSSHLPRAAPLWGVRSAKLLLVYPEQLEFIFIINMSYIIVSKMVQLEPIDSLLSRLNKPVVVNTDDESLDVRIR